MKNNDSTNSIKHKLNFDKILRKMTCNYMITEIQFSPKIVAGLEILKVSFTERHERVVTPWALSIQLSCE